MKDGWIEDINSDALFVQVVIYSHTAIHGWPRVHTRITLCFTSTGLLIRFKRILFSIGNYSLCCSLLHLQGGLLGIPVWCNVWRTYHASVKVMRKMFTTCIWLHYYLFFLHENVDNFLEQWLFLNREQIHFSRKHIWFYLCHKTTPSIKNNP